jgi:hypothetical protein
VEADIASFLSEQEEDSLQTVGRLYFKAGHKIFPLLLRDDLQK